MPSWMPSTWSLPRLKKASRPNYAVPNNANAEQFQKSDDTGARFEPRACASSGSVILAALTPYGIAIVRQPVYTMTWYRRTFTITV